MKNLKFRKWRDGKMIHSDEFNMFYEFFEQASLDPDDAMMGSGVMDKNGKEIYEGDIVKYCRFIDDGIEKWNIGNGVVFEMGCFWVGNKAATGSFMTNDYRGGSPALMYWQSPKWLEVIGNIHQNPELLKHYETNEN